MSDIDELKRLLGEVKSGLVRIARIEGVFQIERDLTDALSVLDNMEEPITERFQLQIDKYNEMIALLKEMKDMIEPPEEPEKEREKVEWIVQEHPGNFNYKCPVCKTRALRRTPFCPSCGISMEVE